MNFQLWTQSVITTNNYICPTNVTFHEFLNYWGYYLGTIFSLNFAENQK